MKVAVVGASLGGLAAANVFHQLGATVKVFEKFSNGFSQRGAGLGFVDVSLWESLRGTTMMRRGRRASRSQGAFFYGDLWEFLYAGLPKESVTFGHTVEDLGDDMMRPTIAGASFDLVIVADGGWSKLRRYVTSTQPEYAGYVGWRGQVDAARVPGGFDAFGIYKNGHFDTIILPCAKDDGTDLLVGGVFVATPASEVVRPKEGASRHVGSEEIAKAKQAPDWLLPLYRQKFGTQAGGELVRLFETFAAFGEVQGHPQYDYAADKVSAGRVILVGDAAHMASPRTAAGAHTAILDALALRAAFGSGTGTDESIRVYSQAAVRRAKELYMRSVEVRKQFTPAGGMAAVKSPSQLVGRAMT